MYNSYECKLIRAIDLIDGATEDETSKIVNCIGAKHIAFEFSGDENIANRSGEFTVEVSVDGGDTYHDLNRLLQNDSTDRDALVGSVTIDTASASTLAFVDNQVTGAITHLKVSLAVTDSTLPAGTLSAKVSVQK